MLRKIIKAITPYGLIRLRQIIIQHYRNSETIEEMQVIIDAHSKQLEELKGLDYSRVERLEEGLDGIYLDSDISEYESCQNIEEAWFAINGRIDQGDECIKACCEWYPPYPYFISLQETAEETLKKFFDARKRTIAECMKASMLKRQGIESKRKITEGCAKCPFFTKAKWAERRTDLIKHVYLAVYPSPCQSKCVYCNVGEWMRGFNVAESKIYYEKVFEVISLAKEKNMIADDANWTVACGEITIHPLKERIYDFVRGQATKFYTNGFVYDEGVAENLRLNPRSDILLSLDSGTPETFAKMKGVDKFDVVLKNMDEYCENGARPGQVRYKYILMPGLNDNLSDYEGIVQTMKRHETNNIILTRDYRRDSTYEEKQAFIYAAKQLVRVLRSNDIDFHLVEIGITNKEFNEILDNAEGGEPC